MIEISGKYNKAIVFCDEIEEDAKKQIKSVCDLYIFRDQNIRIMPDCHSGKGCVIGFTAQVPNQIVPSLIGVDIGCGMMAVALGQREIDFESLDQFIKANIPSGFEIYDDLSVEIEANFEIELEKISKLTHSEAKKHMLSLGTLGSGNHFIEIDVNLQGEKYLVIHTGSRNFGHQVATFYQRKAMHYCERTKKKLKLEREQALKRIRKQKNKALEKEVLSEFEEKMAPYHVSNALAFLEGQDREDYLRDMKFAQKYASLNRTIIAQKICAHLGTPFESLFHFETVHNYINFEDMMIRKGAVSAQKGERLIIPINMRDGAIVAIGKGNEAYNYSAPHGAGRLLSRRMAIEKLSLSEFQDEMKGIYSSSVTERTLDESPMAYKSIEMILKYIEDTVDVVEIIRPLYNFKA
ncbi:RtcB family protein [Fusibacter ferrireducens]|uniref:3'-phosphate/5'-hydroxy nucleic acid ligase n=1 Tax=Fusibacter ferrireducens TaxID=2785058 RepID=A0ABR9ZV02_9FIRM|nr:RtcB family protein [Fusibacter ferrireducens]MBF4693720.1 RtcB family protein [Fusibacter ferrireducens]